MIENPIGTAADLYRTVTINPTVSAGVQGTAAFGAGYIGWERMMNTLRSLLRRPISYMTKMTPREFDEEWQDIQDDPKMRYIIPGSIGAGVAGLSLLASHRPNEEYGGLLSWNGKAKPFDSSVYRGYIMPGTQNLAKSAALKKLASSAFEYGGYVPTIDYSKVLDGPATKRQLFTNDPWMQGDSFTRNMGVSIFADAQNREGSSNISMGTLHDTAADKFKTKFSLMGVTGIAAKTMFANTAADLLVNAIGTMVDIPQETREDLISAGTWYQAAKSILT